ncbi:MAG TPA: TonB-dependent receptor [Lentimicrobium sp.]|nr:TonB-dependent receptor [Lentimicrobium sp.]
MLSKIYSFLIVFFFLSIPLFAQKITVIDDITKQPIANVAIYSTKPNLSTITNPRGGADITQFKGVDSVFIKHMSYEEKVMSYNELSANKEIYLKVNNFSLEEVIISANRWEQNNLEVPHRIEKMSQKEIQFLNPQTAADLLGAGGFAYIQKSQLAGGSPILRGFSTNRVLLVVDGIRMNNAIFRTGNLQNVISLDALSIESNEILFGPGAVMYGSDAIGGVMDFHTLNPVLQKNGKMLVTGSAIGRFSSANSEKTGHLNFNIGLAKWAFRTAITFSDYSDLKTGKYGNSYFLRPVYQKTVNGRDTTVINPDPQKQIYSAYNQRNILQRVLFAPSDRLHLDYGLYYSETSNAPRYDRLYLTDDNGNLVNAEWYYGPQKWLMNRLTANMSGYSGVFNDVKIEVAHQLYKESRHDRKMNNSRLRNQYEKVNAYSLNIDFDKKLNEKSSLFYGIEAVYNKVNSTADRRNIFTGEITGTNTRYPDNSIWQSYAAYGTYKYAFNSKWTLNTGLRYSYIALKADFDTTMFPFSFTNAELNNGALNGSIGLVWLPNRNTQLYANLSTGFRSPNIDDLGKVFDSEPGTVVVPNPDLEPEYAYNGEIGTAFTKSDFLKVNFSLYYTFLNNALARRDFSFNGRDSIEYDGVLSKVEAIQNITKAYVYGTQIGIEFIPYEGFKIKSRLSYQHGEEQSEDSLKYYPLRHAVPLFGSTHLIYERQKLQADLYADYNAGIDYEDLPLSEISDSAPYAKNEKGEPFVPGWYTLNLKISWFASSNLTLSGGIENITNQLYRPFASGISAPGINFIGSLKVSF